MSLRHLFRSSVHSLSFASPSSGPQLIGNVVDLAQATGHTNVFAVGGPNSGKAYLQIQTADSPASGSFTDPTSGDTTLHGSVMSGGVLLVNSGFLASGRGFGTAPISGLVRFASGGIQGASFLRPHRYARINLISGQFSSLLAAGFIGERQITGDGGGFG